MIERTRQIHDRAKIRFDSFRQSIQHLTTHIDRIGSDIADFPSFKVVIIKKQH